MSSSVPTGPSIDYVNTIYDPKRTPLTSYPDKLTAYLCQRFGLRAGQSLLEVGCGRGEFLNGFHKHGLVCQGIDTQPDVAMQYFPHLPVINANAEEGPWPLADNSVDVIYSKSLLEHLEKPDRYLREARRVLKPGGLILTLVPDWQSNYKIYFDDFTHRTPFTKVSLHDILSMTGFEHNEVFVFRQLPVVWKYPALNALCWLVAPFVPVRTQQKFFRWSRELMLIGKAYKPH